MKLQGVFSGKTKGAPFEEQRALARLEAQLAVGAWVTGGVAGLLRGLYGASSLGLLLWSLLGLLLLVAGGVAGCFLGLCLRHLQQQLRSQRPTAEDEKPRQHAQGAELVGSLTLGSAAGGFLGLLAALVSGHWATAPYTGALGALAGACLFTMAGDLVRVVMRMLILDSRAARGLGPPPEGGEDKRSDQA